MNLKDYLRKTGLTAFQFACEADISPTVISKILTGKQSDMYLSLAIRIQRATRGLVMPSDLISESAINHKMRTGSTTYSGNSKAAAGVENRNRDDKVKKKNHGHESKKINVGRFHTVL